MNETPEKQYYESLESQQPSQQVSPDNNKGSVETLHCRTTTFNKNNVLAKDKEINQDKISDKDGDKESDSDELMEAM